MSCECAHPHPAIQSWDQALDHVVTSTLSLANGMSVYVYVFVYMYMFEIWVQQS